MNLKEIIMKIKETEYESPSLEVLNLSIPLNILEVLSLEGGVNDLENGGELTPGEFDEPWG